MLDIALDDDRRPLAAGQRRLGRRQPGSGAHRAHGKRRRGASALLVFPPAPFTLGQTRRPWRWLISGASPTPPTFPIIVFQYPLATGQGYPRETLWRLSKEVPTIRAIKDWAGNVPQHEMHIRTLQSLSRPVNVLTTHSAWLLSSLVLGCNGLLSGSGSVIADLQAQLFRAVQAGDLAAARRLNDRIYPLARVFYAEPWADMHNRMKEALVLLGRLPRAVVRPPLVKLGRAEIERIRAALVEAGLLAAMPAATPPERRDGCRPEPRRRSGLIRRSVQGHCGRNEEPYARAPNSGGRRIIWLNVLTVVSAAILISAEVFGAAFAGGWAVANLFEFGIDGVHIFQAIFFVLRHRRDVRVRAPRQRGRAVREQALNALATPSACAGFGNRHRSARCRRCRARTTSGGLL